MVKKFFTSLSGYHCQFLHACESDAWLNFYYYDDDDDETRDGEKSTFIRLWWLSGLPTWLSGKESSWRHKRHGFDPWVGKIPWSRKW